MLKLGEIKNIPIENFSNWINDQVKRHGTPTQFGAKVGLSFSRVEQYRNKVITDSRTKESTPRTMISLSVVDKCAVKAGIHISDIYPDYYDWPVDEAA